jgi:FlaA1/EpsC-like NDP-sugar epimerase/lipopolysaccharide/colanic/teichoic acid biosynthesis glycosyltransferase
VFDLVLVGLTLPIVIAIIGIAALYLRAAVRGSIFVREERCGAKGTVIRLIRLRTTGAGRALDLLGIASLPEVFNVFGGQMSLIGPRPCLVGDAARYTPSETRLLAVRPGLISPAWPVRRSVVPTRNDLVETMDARREAASADRLIELHYLQRRTLATDAWTIVRVAGWLVIRLASLLGSAVARVIPWVAADTLIAAASFVAAYLLRFLDTSDPYGALNDVTVLRAIALTSLGFALMNVCFRLHRRAWRYAAGVEVLPIAVAALLSGAVASILDLLHPGAASRTLPLSVLVIGSLFSAVGFTIFRYRTRIAPALTGLRRPAAKQGPSPTRAVVYGAGEVGQLLVRRLSTHPDGRQYKVVAFLDDDPRKRGLSVHGIKVVGGRHALRTFVEKEAIEVILLAMANPTGPDVREIFAVAQTTSAQIKVVHDVVNWMGDRQPTALLRDVRAEDLIGRRPASLDQHRCRELVSGKTVLVSGACGSIGSELIRQILALEPARVVAVDMNESGLYDLAIEAKLQAHVPVRVVVGDVTNRPRMLELMRSESPEVIFHVAAYKHVPLMEQFPEEAAWTNVWGTWVMADAAASNGAAHFVLVSTDKAVNPSSIMGATKRMAEILVHASRGNGRRGNPARPVPNRTIVRFGNVLGSRGSVIPTFERQIQLGGPITVTHPDMTRYFMHPEEAAMLIVEAASLSTSDAVFMLDMGDRIRIEDLAYKMIRLRGLRPGIDIALEYTGLRPGEKLHEELTYSTEHRLETAHPRVFQITSEQTQTSSAAEARLREVVRDFVNGTLSREAFSAALVAMASETVADPRSAAPHDKVAAQAYVGRRWAQERGASVSS